MKEYRQLYDLLGLERFISCLKRDEMISILNTMNVKCSKMNILEMVEHISHADDLPNVLSRLDNKNQEEGEKRTREELLRMKGQKRTPITKREILSLDLNNVLEALTDSEYEQVVKFAQELRGKRTPQFY